MNSDPKSENRANSLWTKPDEGMPDYDVEVLAIVAPSGGLMESARNVLLVRKEADDATWFTADDGSELSYDWDVLKWMPACKPDQDVLEAADPQVQAYIAMLEENARVLETRNRRTALSNKTLRGHMELYYEPNSNDTDEVARYKEVIAGLTEQLAESADELARVTTQRNRADQRAIEAYSLLRQEREGPKP